MSEIFESAADLVGGTPMLRASRYAASRGAAADLLVKLECMNPAGSIKDRAAASMIADAERRGALRPGSVIVEPTSGNTGIGLASIAAVKGYRVMLTMPETMSAERRAMLAAYGAEIVLTDGSLGMTGAIERARELEREIDGAVILGQFDSPANVDAHYTSTGPEIWRQTGGRIDALVAGVGTGGTITGVGRYLKERAPSVRVVAVEPEGSPILSGGNAGAHGLQGIGAGFVPSILDTDVYDEVIAISDEDAFAEGREFARREGIIVGISSGAALAASLILARRPEMIGKAIAAVLPDSGDRYLSTKMFGERNDA